MMKPPPTKYGPADSAAPMLPMRPAAALQPKADAMARPPSGYPPPAPTWPAGLAGTRAATQLRAANTGVILPKPAGKLMAPPPPAAGSIIQQRPNRNVIQAMDIDSDSSEESEDDVSYGSDAEWAPDPNEDVHEPLEYIGNTGENRPGSYGSQFDMVYFGGNSGNFTIQNSLGTKQYNCYRFTCDCSKHSDWCDRYVYIVKSTSFSPTTPVRKKVQTRYVTKTQRPPMCHVVDWVILRDGLKAYCGRENLSPGTFQKFVCWGNYDNLTTGRLTCNIKSNKNQKKYDTLSNSRQTNVDNYIDFMVKRQQSSGDICGNYGNVWAY